MEPENRSFRVRTDTPKLSETTRLIGGIAVHIYGLDKVPAGSTEIAIMYILNWRQADYHYSERMAQELDRIYSDANGEVPIIFVTHDLSNHGTRLVDDKKNVDWALGNTTNGLDLLSTVTANTVDTQMIINFLPMYVDLPEKRYNIVSGVSQGGHSCFMLPALVKNLFAAIPIVGSPVWGSLLLERLLAVNDLPIPVEWETVRPLLQEQGKLSMWPESLHRYTREKEREADAVDTKKLHMYVLSASNDKVVNAKYARHYVETHPNVKYYEQSGCGHKCSNYMLYLVGTYLAEILSKTSKL